METNFGENNFTLTDVSPGIQNANIALVIHFVKWKKYGLNMDKNRACCSNIFYFMTNKKIESGKEQYWHLLTTI